MKKILYAIIPFSYLLVLLFQTDLSMLSDLGRHLKLGEVILNCRCVPSTNLFSYTNPDFPVVNHEWLTEVIFYLISNTFGLNALLVLKMLLIITSFSIIYSIALKKGSQFWVTIFSIPAITIFSMRFSVLPELFSYLFISLFMMLLEKYKETKKTYFLYPLPFIELLWVNMHIYFIIGIAIYGLFVLEQVLNSKRLNKKLLIIGLLIAASTLVNPAFLKGALLPFTFSQNYGLNVEENSSPLKIFEPTTTNSNIAYTLVLQVVTFEILVIVFIFGFFSKNILKNLFYSGNGLIGALLGLLYTRCISLFGLLGLIPLVKTSSLLETNLKNSVGTPLVNIFKAIVLLLVCSIMLIHLKGLYDYKILQFGFIPSSEKAAEFIKQNEIQGNIFNNYIIGNYLIFALYPEQKVYIDARPESYPASFFREYDRMMSDEEFFKTQVKKYDINAVVFNVLYEDPSKSRPFLLRLLQGTEWSPVYADGTVTIFVRTTGPNSSKSQTLRINF